MWFEGEAKPIYKSLKHVDLRWTYRTTSTPKDSRARQIVSPIIVLLKWPTCISCTNYACSWETMRRGCCGVSPDFCDIRGRVVNHCPFGQRIFRRLCEWRFSVYIRGESQLSSPQKYFLRPPESWINICTRLASMDVENETLINPGPATLASSKSPLLSGSS